VGPQHAKAYPVFPARPTWPSVSSRDTEAARKQQQKARDAIENTKNNTPASDSDIRGSGLLEEIERRSAMTSRFAASFTTRYQARTKSDLLLI